MATRSGLPSRDAVLWLLLALLVSAPAAADELRPGYLELTQKSAHDWTLVWKSPMRGGVTPNTRPLLPDGCRENGDARRERMPAALITTVQVRCADDVSGKRIGLDAFSAAQTDVLVRVAPLNRPVQVLRLTAAAADGGNSRPSRSLAGCANLFRSPVWSISCSVMIICCLSCRWCCLLSGFWTIVRAVTAFTVAHSLTLIGTTLGLLGLPQRPVESVIALSIMFLAVEIVKKQPGQPRLSERVALGRGFRLRVAARLWLCRCPQRNRPA
jgi:hypothetical protein